MNGTWPVTLPPCALTTGFAAFSLKRRLELDDRLDRPVRRLGRGGREAGLRVRGGLGHRADDSERHDRGHDGNGQPATAAEHRVGEHAGHLLVPLSKIKSWIVGGRAISLRGDL